MRVQTGRPLTCLLVLCWLVLHGGEDASHGLSLVTAAVCVASSPQVSLSRQHKTLSARGDFTIHSKVSRPE